MTDKVQEDWDNSSRGLINQDTESMKRIREQLDRIRAVKVSAANIIVLELACRIQAGNYTTVPKDDLDEVANVIVGWL